MAADNTPPIYRLLLNAGSDPADRTVTLVLGSDDNTAIRVDLVVGLVGPVMAALAAEAYKLNEVATEEELKHSATLSAKAAWISQDDKGQPVLVFELANGTPLPLVMNNGDFAGLAAEMALLAQKPKSSAH